MGKIKYPQTLNIFLLCYMLLFSNCKKFENAAPSGSGPAPQQVTNVSVLPLNGAAIIKYAIPNDPNFSYVRADYETSPGVPASIKASAFTQQITVQGFADTLVHTVKLYSVSTTGALSASMDVTVTPLIPQYLLTRKTLVIQAAFGGINVQALNNSRSDLVFTPLLDTTGHGNYLALDKTYTADSAINFTIRNYNGHGFDTIPYKIAFTVSDRWLHVSDTIVTTVKPLYEALLDKNKMTYMQLPGDATFFDGSSFSLWLTDDLRHGWVYGLTIASATPQPVTWALDDQKNAYKLNRIIIYPYNEPSSGGYYSTHAPKVFEIWGSNNPSPDGSWTGWDKLGHFEVQKPSGLPYGQQNTDDVNYAYNGWEFDFGFIDQSYKYLRMVDIQTWAGQNEIGISSFQLYGVKD
jgi:hypothetical protein